MGKHSKDKGSAFERTVCKRLSMWASGLTRQDIFWRSSLSGGRATFMTKRHIGSEKMVANQAGDISAISPEGQPLVDMFFIDCKHLEDLKLDTIVYGAAGQLRDIWYEPKEKALQFSKIPLVVAKEDYRNPLVLTNTKGKEILEKSVKGFDCLPLKAWYPKEDLHIYSFRDLLADVDYKRLCNQK